MKRMTIDEKVALLMQGTDYGDETIAAAMARELGERLLESEKSGRPLHVYCGTIRAARTSTSVTRSHCANCASFRILGTR